MATANKAMYTHHSTTERNPVDDYATPSGFVVSFMRKLELPKDTEIWDPAGGRGHLIRALLDEGYDNLMIDDLVMNGEDFFEAPPEKMADWIITNPPYKHTEAMVRQALAHSRVGVAMLTNSAFLEGVRRHRGLFTERPPQLVLMNSRKMKYRRGEEALSSVFSHTWLVWRHDRDEPTRLDWIEPFGDLTIPIHDPGVWDLMVDSESPNVVD